DLRIFDDRNRGLGVTEDAIVLGDLENGFCVRQHRMRSSRLWRSRRHQKEAKDTEQGTPDFLHLIGPDYNMWILGGARLPRSASGPTADDGGAEPAEGCAELRIGDPGEPLIKRF